VLLLLLLATPAWAEGERALSVGFSYATFSTQGKAVGNQAPPTLTPDFGLSLSATYEHAIGSDFSLRGDLGFAGFTGGNTKKQSSLSFAGLIDAGFTYRFDILKYVPYAFGGVGGVFTGGGPIDTGANFVLVVGGGCDWLVSRDRSYGVEAKLASFGSNVTVFTVGLRGTVRWGYF
jgi:hypothetical protein